MWNFCIKALIATGTVQSQTSSSAPIMNKVRKSMKCPKKLLFWGGMLFTRCAGEKGHVGWHGNDARLPITWKLNRQGKVSAVRFASEDDSRAPKRK